MKKLAFLAVLVSACAFAAPQFVTPAMMMRNGLTDEQYELLWSQGKHPQIDIAAARDWIFRASRYQNVTNWLEVLGRTNDFARLSNVLQAENFAISATNTTLRADLSALYGRYTSATNREAIAEACAAIAEARAARLDTLRAYLEEQRDKAVLPSTKAIYQALIDLIDSKS